MSEWQEIEIPREAQKAIRKAGGIPMRALMYSRDGIQCRVLVSRDPSGDNGAVEWHASMSWAPEQPSVWRKGRDLSHVSQMVKLFHPLHIDSGEGVPVLNQVHESSSGVTHLWFKPEPKP